MSEAESAKKRGRPRLPDDVARIFTLQLRLTEEEFQVIDEMAKELGITLSEAARCLMFEAT